MSDPRAVIAKYFPNGAPEVYKDKFTAEDKKALANVKSSEDIKNFLKEKFGGEIPKELYFFDGNIPDDLLEALKNLGK